MTLAVMHKRGLLPIFVLLIENIFEFQWNSVSFSGPPTHNRGAKIVLGSQALLHLEQHDAVFSQDRRLYFRPNKALDLHIIDYLRSWFSHPSVSHQEKFHCGSQRASVTDGSDDS